MSTGQPLSRMPKPSAEQYKDVRKLLLAPLFVFPISDSDEVEPLLEKYWSEIRDQVQNLERSLGLVTEVFHENVFLTGDDGLNMVERINPKGHSFVQTLIRSTANLVAFEDQETIMELSDWQRCLSIGIMSEKVRKIVLDGYTQISTQRSELLTKKINESIPEGGCAIIFTLEESKIQFPEDIQVFYISPPSLNEIKNWIDEKVKSFSDLN